ncbi:MAG: hypothetical protein ACRDY7_11875, partial [Acidimicrobiia bacterium]
ALTDGDEEARDIWRRAADELAVSAAAAARRMAGSGAAAPVALSWSGSLFSVSPELLLEPFLDRLGAHLPQARPAPPLGDPLAGGARLAGPDGPGLFAPLVHTSPILV